jgi:hypothetical protein
MSTKTEHTKTPWSIKQIATGPDSGFLADRIGHQPTHGMYTVQIVEGERVILTMADSREFGEPMRTAAEIVRRHNAYDELVAVEIAARIVAEDFEQYGEVMQSDEDGDYSKQSAIGRLLSALESARAK